MKKGMIYILYAAAVTLVFLYCLFPTEAVTAYINYQVSKSLPGLKVSIDRIRPSFPPGLRFNGVNLLDKDRSVFSAELLKITPVYLKILSSEKSFHVSGDSCGGRLEGTVRVLPSKGKPGFSMDLVFGGLRMERIQGLQDRVPAKLSGTAKGSLVFSTGQPLGKGSVDLAVSGCSLEFTPSLFGIHDLKFESIDAGLELAGRRLLLKKFDMKSDQVSGSASGSLNLELPVEKSQVSISGHILPQPAFVRNLGDLFPVELFFDKKNRNTGIPFRISGTLEHPNFKIR